MRKKARRRDEGGQEDQHDGCQPLRTPAPFLYRCFYAIQAIVCDPELPDEMSNPQRIDDQIRQAPW